MNITLKSPGINLLTLEYDEVLSTFAFNFNLRRYMKAQVEAADEAKAGVQTQLSQATAEKLEAGAYTRPLLSST
jgi:hypothetical protein